MWMMMLGRWEEVIRVFFSAFCRMVSCCVVDESGHALNFTMHLNQTFIGHLLHQLTCTTRS